MHLLTASFALLLLLALACRIWLLSRQSASARAARDRVPDAFRDAVPPDAHRKASDYTIANAKLASGEAILDTALFALLTWGGGLAWLDAFWRGRGLEGVALGLAVIVSAWMVTALAGWPLSLYRLFGIETRFGFNRMGWRLYLADLLKSLALMTVLGLPLLALILWLMQSAGRYWWWYAWLAWAGFSVTLTWAYPAFIAPLFNRFQPLGDASLRERIESLLTRCGFSSRGIYVMDGSRRSAHGNAYFTGFGASKRIVLFDTLIARLSPEEIEAVVAHELGHFRLHHVRWRLVLTLALGLGGLYVLGWLSTQPTFYAAFGVATPSPHMALLLFVLVLPVLTFWLSPLGAAWSRRHEFAADRYATRQANAGQLASALVKLYRENATTLAPDAIYSAFFDSHPPAPVRIARLRAAVEPA
ncbi:MAG TPA: M48 family metallopeptidase [Steroidobacteraceae bacterium]|nr:M48 family metallopeptidase [Steroidobacteraceae bacterium]